MKTTTSCQVATKLYFLSSKPNTNGQLQILDILISGVKKVNLLGMLFVFHCLALVYCQGRIAILIILTATFTSFAFQFIFLHLLTTNQNSHKLLTTDLCQKETKPNSTNTEILFDFKLSCRYTKRVSCWSVTYQRQQD